MSDTEAGKIMATILSNLNSKLVSLKISLIQSDLYLKINSDSNLLLCLFLQIS